MDSTTDSTSRKRRALAEARAIVARHVPRDRDLVAELIDERRLEALREETEC